MKTLLKWLLSADSHPKITKFILTTFDLKFYVYKLSTDTNKKHRMKATGRRIAMFLNKIFDKKSPLCFFQVLSVSNKHGSCTIPLLIIFSFALKCLF